MRDCKVAAVLRRSSCAERDPVTARGLRLWMPGIEAAAGASREQLTVRLVREYVRQQGLELLAGQCCQTREARV
jgi:hypothetical protein